MSNQKSLQTFFSGKVFKIPRYQRSYAWEKEHVNELFEDIQEAITTQSQHYIGTVVIAKTNNPDQYTVVDGQQRLTTLLMLIACLIRKLPDSNRMKSFYSFLYVKDVHEKFKLTPLKHDREFYFQLLSSDEVAVSQLKPQNKSQKFLLGAFEEINNLIDGFRNKELKILLESEGQRVDSSVEKIASITSEFRENNLQELLKSVESLSILEFVEKDESDAIRIFQTVNDRGKELSRMEKMKSLLFYFSDKYLDRRYDDPINSGFADIFGWYDEIKMIGEKYAINTISSKKFTEDDLLRHHHICFSQESYDPTADDILSNVKVRLHELRSQENAQDKIDKYLSSYFNSLVGYIKAFHDVLCRVETDSAYYKLFSIQGLAVALYPVIAQLEKKQFLSQQLPKRKVSVLRMLEIIDLRLFKVRKYGGKKHAAEFAFRLNNEDWLMKGIEEHLKWFNSFEISNAKFIDHLTSTDYTKTDLLRTLFINHCERLQQHQYTLDELRDIMGKNPTIEHILSQSPMFKPSALGFKSDQDFETHVNLLGNLTLLEKKLNSSVQNGAISAKANTYKTSGFRMTTVLGTALTSDPDFKKQDLINRGHELAADFAKWWPE
ncbi:hypothetical protein CKO12_11380 [Chromatium okenii]|uniref:DUF262 domain-containing protein n=1 Tax=Chromatium okenii TaxID=61644 RepID=UPI0019054025|nr:DUF262 domain-containing protein [Chromatium okenii]MBK1642468.1 hypothetical protein [Chromatium okenii]